MTTLSQNRAPREESEVRVRQNAYYPQSRVVLSVVFERFGDPDEPKVFNVFPRNVTIYNNSYKEADTWSLEFDAQDLPFTPELIRAGTAEIYLFQTRGIGQLPEVIKGDEEEGAPDSFTFGLSPTIVGLFDDVELQMGDDGKVITINGTDYTSLFIGKQWSGESGNLRGRIPSGRRLDDVLKTLMGQVEGARAMTLTTVVDGALPIVGSAEGRTNKRGLPVKSGSNYWDVMYNLAIRYGYILFVQDLQVILTTPQTFVAEKTKSKKMFWGQNLLSLRMSRRIGKEQVPIIRVSAYSETDKRTISAQFPAKPRQQNVNGIGVKQDEIQEFTIGTVKSKKQLLQVAETYFHLKARSEQVVEIETMDLKDSEGNNLLNLRAGDAVSIGFAPFNPESVIFAGQTTAQRRQTLVGLGYPEDVASEIANGFDRVNLFARPFRVKESNLEWSHDGGLRISAELQNFVNIEGFTP